MKTIGIFAARHKPLAGDLARRLIELGRAHGVQVFLQEEFARTLAFPELARDQATLAACDAIITLTGDGGVLSAARAAAPHQTPILAIDLGRLGFLSAVRPEKLDAAFEMLLRGEFDLEERMMLDARVLRGGIEVGGEEFEDASAPEADIALQNPKVVGGSIGLNDAVVAKSALARILRLSIYVEGDLVAEVRADGLVISTPTGSTAYALAAGGPIVHPDVELMLICPICPHSLAQRPLVVGPQETVEVHAEWEGDEVPSDVLEAMLTIDGQVGVRLQSGDVVRVERAKSVARLLRLRDDSFYERLRHKMQWGR